MAILIKWTNEARITFDKNISYLLKEWTEREIKNFVKQTHHILQRIENQPEMFRPSQKSKNVRKALINKYITLYYRYYAARNEVILLTFWHIKQDPKKLKY